MRSNKKMKRKIYMYAFLLMLPVIVLPACKEHSKTTKQPVAKMLFRDSIPVPAAYVNDYENIYTPAEEQQMNTWLASWKQQDSQEVAVVTLDTTMTTAENFDSLVIKVANAWGVGDEHKSNGIMIGISKGLRRIMISTGTNSPLPDEITKDILEQACIPLLRKEAYFEATMAGLHKIKDTLQYIQLAKH